MGIPQGGIDSPYVFNIYLYYFDKFVHEKIAKKLERLNNRMKKKGKPIGNRAIHKIREKIISKTKWLKVKIKKLRKSLAHPKNLEEYLDTKRQLYVLIQTSRLNKHRIRKMPYNYQDRKDLRLFYVRYADDWILLTNASNEICERIKSNIKYFLHNELGATLAYEKTAITDMREKPAHFLGFELTMRRRNRFKKQNKMLRQGGGKPIQLRPYREILINRMYSRGFCTKKGLG